MGKHDRWVNEPEYTRNCLKREITRAQTQAEFDAAWAQLQEWNRKWDQLKPGDPQPVGRGATNPGAVLAS